MSKLGKALAAYDSINSLLGGLVCVIIVLMMLAVSFNTLSRYLLSYSVNGVVEACEWAIMSIPFLGAAWLLRSDGHIKMDLVLNQLSPRQRAGLNLASSVLGVIICLVFTWYVVQNTWEDFLTGYYRPSVLSLPRAPFSGIMSLGFALLAIQFVRRIYVYRAEWTSLAGPAHGRPIAQASGHSGGN